MGNPLAVLNNKQSAKKNQKLGMTSGVFDELQGCDWMPHRDTEERSRRQEVKDNDYNSL